MLKASKRVLVDSGRLVFSVVSIPEGVGSIGRSLDAYEFVYSETSYVDLLRTAGFVDIAFEDTTDVYLAVARAWLDAVDDLEMELRVALGDTVFERKVTSRRIGYEQLKAGDLGQTLYSATAGR